LVCKDEEALQAVSAAALANAAAEVFGSPPGRTWVRLRSLPAAAYAENGEVAPPAELPVFVSVLQARPPTGDRLVAEVAALTSAVAAQTGRDAAQVHVTYEPPAVGRQAFGGQLVVEPPD
jgi:phenylpyruvate tautomerase PptA (4-oxalocrotonate tautomerase family)